MTRQLATNQIWDLYHIDLKKLLFYKESRMTSLEM